MPISRYEIRDEYSLADPELFRAADKDDPEALLEGVAMAGLVGVLRQLGDLAEFAAEIFHDLHEEVMSTAARGHGLMIRVQQLEAEVPSIEKAFLSQTDHSSFFYNSGVDWHPNPRMDQNLVTKGDLPRFVMDSYEECRGPPRLFLLDKFDVAGAGACLKRYTDPSFFKVETSMANADVQREKFRKAKKKGPRGRHGETPELLPASHAKLHNLFLEEPDERGVSRPSHRAKLKRRANGFPFDSKTRKSYMEKFFNTPSPEHKMLHGITASSPVWMSSNDQNESDLDLLELRSLSPARESVIRKINPPPQDWEGTLNPFMNQINDESTDIKMTNGIPSTFDEKNGEKDITVYGESKTEGSLTGYQSDDIASEIDNYMDAPSTIESEMDTDSELRVKNDVTSSKLKSQPSVSVKNGAHLHSQSSDSQSTGDLTISDEGSNSCKKDVSSFLSSASSRISAENPHSEKLSAEVFPSADVPEIALINSSVYQKTPVEDFPVEGLPEHVVSSGIFSGKDVPPKKSPEFEPRASVFGSSNSTRILPHSEKKTNVIKYALPKNSPKFERRASVFGSSNSIPILPHSEKKTNVIKYTPRIRSVSHSKSLSGDDSSSSGEQDAPCTSNIAEIISHTADSPAAISAYLLHEDDNDREGLNQFGNVTSTLNMGNILSHDRINAEEIISTESMTLGNVGDEVLKLPNNFAFDSTDIAHTEDVITSKDPIAENQNDNLYDEDSNVVSDAPNRFSYTMEASTGKEFSGTSLTNANTASSEDNYSNCSVANQISSETLIYLKSEDSPDVHEAGHDTHDRVYIPEEVNTINEIPELGTPKSCEVEGLQCTGKMNDVTPNDLVDSIGTSDTAQEYGFSLGSGITGLENSEISSTDMKLLSEVRVHLDESDFEIDQSEITPIACCIPAVSDNTITEDVDLSAGVRILVEEHIPSFDDTGLGCDHENDETSFSGSNKESELMKANENYHSGSQTQSSLVEEMKAREDATLHYNTVSCSTENNDQPESKSEVPYAVLDSYYESEVERSSGFLSAAQIQSPLEQSGFDTTKYFQQSGVENQVSDANSSPIDCASDETMLQENIELPPDQIGQELLDSDDQKSELSFILPSNHQKILDQVNNEVHNNLAPLSPHFSCPPSVSGLSGLSNYGSDVTAYPKGPSGFVFPLSNLFSQTDQINPDEVPPMPPLPPLQWRMGMLQHASSTTEVEKLEHKEESLQDISPPAASTSNVSSSAQTNNPPTQISPQISLEEESLEQKFPNLEANSKHDPVGLSPKIECAQHQLVMPTQKNDDGELHQLEMLTQKNDDGEQHQLVMPTQKNDEGEQHQLVMPTQKNDEGEQHQLVMPTQKNDEGEQHQLEMPTQKNDDGEQHQLVMPTQKNDDGEQHQLVIPTQKNDDGEQHQLVMPTQKNDDGEQHQLVMPTQKNDDGQQHQLVIPTQKNDDGEQHQLVMPTQKNNDGEQHQLVMPTQKNDDGQQHQLVMPTQKNDNGEQHQLVMPTQKNDEGTSPAMEDGVASVSRTVKLPRSCNPVIGSAAALDKSKLRKVTEQDRPQLQKPDERDSLLEQIRAKSFNLKPAVASRPSVRGPNTNLKVAAILEKANAIRQALAGSDEDDEDSWSDS